MMVFWVNEVSLSLLVESLVAKEVLAVRSVWWKPPQEYSLCQGEDCASAAVYFGSSQDGTHKLLIIMSSSTV